MTGPRIHHIHDPFARRTVQYSLRSTNKSRVDSGNERSENTQPGRRRPSRGNAAARPMDQRARRCCHQPGRIRMGQACDARLACRRHCRRIGAIGPYAGRRIRRIGRPALHLARQRRRPRPAAPCRGDQRGGGGPGAGWEDGALINGAAGHALDFDDVSSNMIGHPSAPVVPAALASAQIGNACGRQLLRALVVGHGVEARIGEMLGPSHYLHGFHATGTVGTFGAAAACASLRRLSEDQTAHALGLAATQAAGLKSMFGTMAKPLHAGKAAMNGLMATQLALRGFSANDCGIECPQGFALTMAPERHPFVAPIDTAAGFAIESTLFKYHAACYLTHSTIEAIRQLRQQHAVGLDALEGMTITVAGNQRGVCDIEDPKTGLGVKFSIKHLAALALDGADTADLGLYADATALDARYIEARQRIALVITATGDGNAAQVSMRTRQGQSSTQTANVAIPATDLCAQWTRLLAKARSIAEPVIGPERFGRLVEAIVALDRAPTLQPLLDAIR